MSKIIKLMAEINKTNKYKMHKINEIKNFFFEKINNIDKPLAKVIKKTKRSKVEMKRGPSHQTLRKFRKS